MPDESGRKGEGHDRDSARAVSAVALNRLRAFAVVRYGLAFGLLALAEWLRTGLPEAWQVPHWTVLFGPVVLVSAAFGGLGPGIVATVGSVALAAAIAIKGHPALQIAESVEMLVLVVFAVVGLAISLVAGSNRRETV